MLMLEAGLLALAISLLILALIFVLVSIVRFSDILVKLVALEVLVNLLIGAIAIWAWQKQQVILLDVCIALTLVMFLATVAYAQYILVKRR
jgi:multicomponent Na+:H+ antiporter subunit F